MPAQGVHDNVNSLEGRFQRGFVAVVDNEDIDFARDIGGCFLCRIRFFRTDDY